MIAKDNKPQPRIEDIIAQLNDGKERYIWMATNCPTGFDEKIVEKYAQQEIYYTILGKILPESTLLSIRVDGIQYISVPIPPGSDRDRTEQIYRETQDTIRNRDPNIIIPINSIITYIIMDKNEYENIWKPVLMGDVDNIPKDYFEKNPKENTA